MGEEERKTTLKKSGQIGMPDEVAARICAMKIGLIVEDPDDFDEAISAVHDGDQERLMTVLEKHLSNAQANKIAKVAFGGLEVKVSNSLDW